MIRGRQDLAEKLLGRPGIPVLREVEIESSAAGVDRSIEVRPATGDANISFIDSPGGARPFQFGPHPPVEFGSVALHPAPNRRVIDAQASFCHEFFQITIAERETEIPADAKGDHLIREVSSPKEPRPILLHPATLPKAWPSCSQHFRMRLPRYI